MVSQVHRDLLIDSNYLIIGNRRQFFFDDLLLEQVQNLTRRFHAPQKVEGSPVPSKDEPWERVLYFTCNTWNVILDPADGLFKCWYEDWQIDDLRKGISWTDPTTGKLCLDFFRSWPARYLYAQSTDGIHWEKPGLGIVREQGNHHDWWQVGAAEGLEVPESGNLGEVEYALGLAKMKIDRFVSLAAAPAREGTLVIRPVEPSGGYLEVNARCHQGGYVQVAVADGQGNIMCRWRWPMDKGIFCPVLSDTVAWPSPAMRWPTVSGGGKGKRCRRRVSSNCIFSCGMRSYSAFSSSKHEALHAPM